MEEEEDDDKHKIDRKVVGVYLKRENRRKKSDSIRSRIEEDKPKGRLGELLRNKPFSTPPSPMGFRSFNSRSTKFRRSTPSLHHNRRSGAQSLPLFSQNL
ncbi:unnamed protein product [Microthlaspi erraticum]|uniref:Uncharacterized protein n=1 Tax=Microthlaspi erraticum TaxID=1685480 RepID=A0A6D2KD31_9BRAS|nr:unnamed protein product [Microthlaspi erraticum]